MRFRFVADKPIASSTHDGLGFDKIVRDVRTALAETETPFVYGLLGPWGSGKTSIQRLLENTYAAELD
jgi:pantothenate kinase-related protein Tda10